MTVMPDPVDKLTEKLRKTKNRARVEDLVEDMTSTFGGTKKIAERFVAEFNDGKPGGIGRAKLLDAYVRLLTLTSKKESATPISEMTDDELEQAAKDYVGKFLTSTPIVAAKGEANGISPTQ